MKLIADNLIFWVVFIELLVLWNLENLKQLVDEFFNFVN